MNLSLRPLISLKGKVTPLCLSILEYRQLARDREELEDIHKSRMDRIKAREESLLERMLSKEKVVLSENTSILVTC